MSSLELPDDHAAAVFSLNTGRGLLERVCRELGIAPGRHEEREYETGEHKARPLESVRGRDVYVLESLHGDEALGVDAKLVRTLFFVSTLVDAGADRVTVFAPYLCYSRKDRRTKARDPVTSRYLATLFEASGTDRIVTLDVHNPAAFENAFRIEAVHLTAAPLLADALVSLVGDRPAVVVSPDSGGAKRADRFRSSLERRLGREVAFAFVEKFRSEGVIRGGAVGGDVAGKVAIVVDDLVSTGTTLSRAASACLERGSLAAFAAATHGVFSEDASGILESAALERIVITNTIAPRLAPELLAERVEVVDCAPFLAEAIRRLHLDESVSELTER
jgi:ribose-phosphate pyrophosphokinase